ncbi:MAG: flippase [Gemmatimonadaceae bacterium]
MAEAQPGGVHPRVSIWPEVAASERVVARNFLALGTAEILSRLVAFAATVYLARVLGATMYGIVAFASAVALYFAHLGNFGVEVVGVQVVAEQRDRRDGLVGMLLVARLLWATLLGIALAGASLLLLPSPDAVVMAGFALGLPVLAANARWIHLALERTGVAAAARIIGELTTFALLVILVRDAADVALVPFGILIGGAVAAALLLGWLRRWKISLRPGPAWSLLRPVIRRAWPMTVYGLLGLVLYNADLIFLRFTHAATVAGYYAIAYTLISFLSNIGLAYALTLLPTMSRLEHRDGGRRLLYHTATAQVFAASLPAAIGGYLLAPHLIAVIFGAAYEPAVVGLQILIWSVPLSVMRDLPFVALVASAREDRLLHLNALTVLCSIALMVVLIPRFGLIGAAVATLLTEALRFGFALRLAGAEGYEFVRVGRLWRALVAAAAMAICLVAIRTQSLWLLLAVGAASYVGALSLLGAIEFRRGTLPALRV